MPVVRGHFTYTQRDLKYAIEHDQYLEHLVPCLCNTHIHTHTLSLIYQIGKRSHLAVLLNPGNLA